MKSYTASSTNHLQGWTDTSKALALVLHKAGSSGVTIDQIRGRLSGSKRFDVATRLTRWKAQGLVRYGSVQGRVVWYETEELRSLFS